MTNHVCQLDISYFSHLNEHTRATTLSRPHLDKTGVFDGCAKGISVISAANTKLLRFRVDELKSSMV